MSPQDPSKQLVCSQTKSILPYSLGMTKTPTPMAPLHFQKAHQHICSILRTKVSAARHLSQNSQDEDKRNAAEALASHLEGHLKTWMLQPTMVQMAGLISLEESAKYGSVSPEECPDIIGQVASDLLLDTLPSIRALSRTIPVQLGRFARDDVMRNIHTCSRQCVFVSNGSVHVCTQSGQVHLCGDRCDRKLRDHGGISCNLTGHRFKKSMLVGRHDGRHMHFGIVGRDKRTGGRVGMTYKQTAKLDAIEKLTGRSIGLSAAEENKERRADMHRIKPVTKANIQKKRTEAARAMRMHNSMLVNDRQQLEDNRVKIENLLDAMYKETGIPPDPSQRSGIVCTIEDLWSQIIRTSIEKTRGYTLTQHTVAVVNYMRQGFPAKPGRRLIKARDWPCLPKRMTIAKAFRMRSQAVKTALTNFTRLATPLVPKLREMITPDAQAVLTHKNSV